MNPYIMGAQVAMSAYGSYSASKKAKEAGKQAAKLIKAETKESLRRARNQFIETRGKAVSSIGASGVQMSGSPANYVGQMQTEFKKQQAWTRKSGQMRASAAKKGGADMASSIQQQGLLSAINTGLSWYTNSSQGQAAPSTFGQGGDGSGMDGWNTDGSRTIDWGT